MGAGLEALPASVQYLSVDISPVMIDLATSRLAAWADRAEALLVDGSNAVGQAVLAAQRRTCSHRHQAS